MTSHDADTNLPTESAPLRDPVCSVQARQHSFAVRRQPTRASGAASLGRAARSSAAVRFSRNALCFNSWSGNHELMAASAFHAIAVGVL